MARTSSLLLFLALLGCGTSEAPQAVFPVSGTATYEGEPMAGAMIGFHPLKGTPRAPRAQATADSEGRFQMTTYETGDGVPAGTYAITIYWPAKGADDKPIDPTAEEPEIGPDRLGKEYTAPAKTVLRVTVQEKPNTIDLSFP